MCQRKIITHARQYLCSLAIYLRPRSCRDFTIIKEKIQSVAVQFFFFFFNLKTTTKNPNHQSNVFYILRTGFTMDYKMGQTKPLLHELSFKKSSIKNHAILFEACRQPDQT